MTELITLSKGESSHPTEETRFNHLYPRSHSFGHYPQFVIIGEGRNKDRRVNRESHLFAQRSLHHNSTVQSAPQQTLHQSTHRSSITREQDPKTLKLLYLRQNLIPNPEKSSYPLPAELSSQSVQCVTKSLGDKVEKNPILARYETPTDILYFLQLLKS